MSTNGDDTSARNGTPMMITGENLSARIARYVHAREITIVSGTSYLTPEATISVE
jgi:hypothetical protein